MTNPNLIKKSFMIITLNNKRKNKIQRRIKDQTETNKLKEKGMIIYDISLLIT